MARYKWSFDVSGVLTECKPIIEDGTSLDYGQQSGEVFYRAKLNGSLLFRFEFDYILNAGYNAEHIVVLQRYDSDTDDFVDVWRGKFTLTDCEIDFDTHTISVTPETVDRYTAILENIDKEYNIVKLAPQMRPVNILIRPCLQVYLAGESKVSNYIGGNYWETSCDSLVDATEIEINQRLKIYGAFCGIYIEWKSGGLAGKKVVYGGQITNDGSGILKGWVYSGNDGVEDSIDYTATPASGFHNGGTFKFYKGGTLLVTAEIDDFGDVPGVEINDSTLVDGSIVQLDCIYDRFLVQTDEADGAGSIDGIIYDLRTPTVADFAGGSKNYNKYLTIQNNSPIEVYISVETSVDPTVWGQATTDRYFIKPPDTLTDHYMPLGIENWRLVSYWWKAKRVDGIKINDKVAGKFTVTRTIRDAYDYRQTIFKLLEKAGVNPQYIISGCLGGSQDYVGARTDLVITPRSNVISSYYDMPAQNAPISLSNIFRMLKEAYKCYWHIDENGNMHIEHVSYYDNGYSYTEDAPQVLVNLETEQHTRTTESKCFGQNKVKYDKQDMPAQFTFGWGDTQTIPFDGYPINCLDNYVQKGTKSEQLIGDFDTDVDFVMSSPNDVSKDGFFLFALPLVDGNYSQTLKIETVRIQDENGEPYEVTIQNADAAFVKIHETWWRYALPCENIEVNNTDTNAITTGRYKAQTVEFADTSMADVIGDVDECNKIIRTQQGDGHVKTLSINLNSLATKADLLFNFVGRFYYLRGTAIGASITILINGESTTINVASNKWNYRYNEPLTALNFNAADVVSVNFADCDRLESITTADNMFKNCAELLAVDFGGKKLAAVTSANGMFDGCSQLTTLICPRTSTWKPDLSFADSPSLTTESIYSLLGFLYDYDSGVHTIDFNQTMWDALDADTQTDITTRAGAKGWTIGTATVYYINGQSAASTVYATINGTPIEIAVSGGAFSYAYNAPITSLSFENDADVTDIDFSLSDGLSGVTSLNDAFKNCAGLTTVDFTGCDLSNVATATDCFAGCTSLAALTIPTGTWKPDLDLSAAAAFNKAAMLAVIDGLYTYNSGTHTVTFNSTIWDALPVADQQQVFNAAAAKGWTTNAVSVTYVIRGTSTNVNGSETFKIQYINDGAVNPSSVETVTCNVDANGNWEFSYSGKKIYSLKQYLSLATAVTTLDFSASDNFSELTSMEDFAHNNLTLSNVNFGATKSSAKLTTIFRIFRGATAMRNVDLSAFTFENVIDVSAMFNENSGITSVDLRNATFASATNISYMFQNCTSLTSIDLRKATFASATASIHFCYSCTSLTSIDLSEATFEALTTSTAMFYNCTSLTALSFPKATFNSLQTAGGSVGNGMFNSCTNLQTINFKSGITMPNLTLPQNMFRNCEALLTLSLPDVTFANCATVHNMFNGCKAMTTLNLDSATFAAANAANDFVTNMLALTTVVLPSSSTWNVALDFRYSPLTYNSMVYVANWLKDLTGGTAKTVNFKTSAWNALTAAEQTTIDNILSGKNWTRVLAN